MITSKDKANTRKHEMEVSLVLTWLFLSHPCALALSTKHGLDGVAVAMTTAGAVTRDGGWRIT